MSEQDATDKLKRFLRTYSQTDLHCDGEGNVWASGHGVLVRALTPGDRIASYHAASRCLNAAGYTYVGPGDDTSSRHGWLPTFGVQRSQLSDMASQLADYVEALSRIGSPLPVEGQRLTNAAMTKLASTVADINAAAAFIK